MHGVLIFVRCSSHRATWLGRKEILLTCSKRGNQWALRVCWSNSSKCQIFFAYTLYRTVLILEWLDVLRILRFMIRFETTCCSLQPFTFGTPPRAFCLKSVKNWLLEAWWKGGYSCTSSTAVRLSLVVWDLLKIKLPVWRLFVCSSRRGKVWDMSARGWREFLLCFDVQLVIRCLSIDDFFWHWHWPGR